jgi:hypothetical protein
MPFPRTDSCHRFKVNKRAGNTTSPFQILVQLRRQSVYHDILD